MTIKSPYNFVPLSETVVFPDWADKVSHDVPFEDGESGEIEIKITAKSPIFVRNGSAEKDETKFSHIEEDNNKKYFIPGTSLKGAIRNVLEIMSFGKMNRIDDRKFSWRDLSNTDTYTPKFVKDFNSEPLAKAGFIKIENSKWFLIPCEFARIEQCEIDSAFGISILSGVSKYRAYEEKGRNLHKDFHITKICNTANFIKQCGKFKRAKIKDPNDKNYEKTEGTLVFTGQIGPKLSSAEGMHGKGKKHLEFVFFNEKKESEWIEIKDDMRRNFELNHSNDRNKDHHKGSLTPNEEWGFWKPRLENGGKMPVFYLPEGKNNVHSFGLAMLYRLPYDKSVKDLLLSKHKKDKPDFAETMFGNIENNELKGRIQFSHAFAVENIKEIEQKAEVLSSPKATFYPNYIEQNSSKLKVYDSVSKLSGWKIYPLRENVISNKPKDVSEKVFTKFTPLQQGVVFKGKIRFHNLKKEEIGALLSAITFHNTKECFHGIGMAKPLGYGKVEIKIDKTNYLLSKTEEYMKEFEKYMEINMENNEKWLSSQQIKELFTMKSEQNNQDILGYMDLVEFPKAKNKGEYLKRYSKLLGKEVVPKTMMSSEDLNKMETSKVEFLEKIKNEADEKNKTDTIKRMLEELSKINQLDPSKENEWINNWEKNGKNQEIAALLINKIKKKTAKKEYTFNYKKLAEFLNIKLI